MLRLKTGDLVLIGWSDPQTLHDPFKLGDKIGLAKRWTVGHYIKREYDDRAGAWCRMLAMDDDRENDDPLGDFQTTTSIAEALIFEVRRLGDVDTWKRPARKRKATDAKP
jgi:hypothetical protein